MGKNEIKQLLSGKKPRQCGVPLTKYRWWSREDNGPIMSNTDDQVIKWDGEVMIELHNMNAIEAFDFQAMAGLKLSQSKTKGEVDHGFRGSKLWSLPYCFGPSIMAQVLGRGKLSSSWW